MKDLRDLKDCNETCTDTLMAVAMAMARPNRDETETARLQRRFPAPKKFQRRSPAPKVAIPRAKTSSREPSAAHVYNLALPAQKLGPP